MEVRYDDIKNKIKENYIKGLYFIKEYKDDTQKNATLSLALGKKGYLEEEIYSFIEFASNGYKIYEYESRSVGTDKIRENLLVSKNNLPLLKIVHYKPKNSSIDYSEDTYIAYQEGSNRIDSKVSSISLKIENFEDTNVTVLDSGEPFITESRYYQKKYHFILKNDEILSLRVGNEMFLNGENGFSMRCESALKCIDKAFGKIIQKIEKAKDDDVKEYRVLRKKQGH